MIGSFGWGSSTTGGAEAGLSFWSYSFLFSSFVCAAAFVFPPCLSNAICFSICAVLPVSLIRSVGASSAFPGTWIGPPWRTSFDKSSWFWLLVASLNLIWLSLVWYLFSCIALNDYSFPNYIGTKFNLLSCGFFSNRAVFFRLNFSLTSISNPNVYSEANKLCWIFTFGFLLKFVSYEFEYEILFISKLLESQSKTLFSKVGFTWFISGSS